MNRFVIRLLYPYMLFNRGSSSSLDVPKLILSVRFCIIGVGVSVSFSWVWISEFLLIADGFVVRTLIRVFFGGLIGILL